MSYTTIVKGKITKTTKGNHKIYSKGDINITAKKIIINAKEGIEYGQPKSPPVIQANITLPAKCIVQFRPRKNWAGEFGFDWFRLGDTGMDGDVDYNTIVGQYYSLPVTNPATTIFTDDNSWSVNFERDPQPPAFAQHNRVQQLKRLYGIEYYQLNDKQGNAITKEYYNPIIALFAKQQDPNNPNNLLETGKAELKLYLEFDFQNGKEVKPDKLHFEANGQLLDTNNPDVEIDKHTILQKDIKNRIDIEITCKQEFANDKIIEVYAFTKDASGNEVKQLAGKLKMIAPSKKMTKDIVIVKVITSAGKGNFTSLNKFQQILKQSLIRLNITTSRNNQEIKIDLSNTQNNMNQWDFNLLCNVDTTKTPHNIQRTAPLNQILTDTLNRDYPQQFVNHFKLFFFENTNVTYGVNPVDNSLQVIGGNNGFSTLNSNFGVMFSTHDENTIAHECLHGLGLPHTFSNNIFLFKAQETENIMDYSHDNTNKVTGQSHTPIKRISTWKWQWQIINTNI